MRHLQALATQVLLGTERRAAALPAVSGAVGETIAAACPPEVGPDLRVLRAAGILAICGDTGFQPPERDADLPEACPANTWPCVSDADLVSALSQIFDAGLERLCEEALQTLAKQSASLPHGLLPRALSLGQKNPSLRPALLAVLDQRGRWLASHNPEWAYVTALAAADQSLDMTRWTDGTLEERTQLLARLRSTDPDQARQLLQTEFDQFDARERTRLLAQMPLGLAAADEDFLEAALQDRSKDVRHLAADLLARLPNSRYRARMVERLVPCLEQKRKLFRHAWTLEPPAAFGADWKNDALEASRAKGESLGERAWWLYQIARAVPLAWWPQHMGLSPAELTKWAKDTDWAEALFRAWSEALVRQPDTDWARAFLAHAPLDGLTIDQFDLLACLPIAEREQYWQHMLDYRQIPIIRGDILARIVQDCLAHGATLSETFACHVLKLVRNALPTGMGRWDHLAREALPEFVCLIPPSCLDDATNWPSAAPGTDYFTQTLARVLAIVELRKILHRPLNHQKSS